MMANFSIAATGNLLFGADSFGELPRLLHAHGYLRAAFITSKTFSLQPRFAVIAGNLHAFSINLEVYPVSGEPTVESIDAIASEVARTGCDVVVGIGGGSALDSAKAVSAMAPLYRGDIPPQDRSVRRYLEGVGDLAPPADRLPLFAVPTTAGTGSEATKNAVVAEVGPHGFKKSLRHDSYIPDQVILDPALAVGLPHSVTAASGLDALTQLLEAYTSVSSNPFIDALALDAIGRVGNSLGPLLSGATDTVELRAQMAYGAYISGIAIANAGLGYVHGLAGPLGALHHAAHGAVCANLVAPVNRAMMEVATPSFARKMECIGELWHADPLAHLQHLTELAALPRFGDFGFTKGELDAIGAKDMRRNSPVALTPATVTGILHSLL